MVAKAVPDLKEIFKQAADIAQQVPENMQEAAFNRELNVLLGETEVEQASDQATPTIIQQKNSKVTKKKPKVKSTKAKKTKATHSVVKDLNLRPKDKRSFNDFVNEKSPASIKEKCTTSIYYLCHELNEKQVGIDHVYTCFKNVKWSIPKDLKNSLHQSASEGW